MRIISLLPSATEIICGLGLRDSLVAVTHECDYPADVSRLPKVTRSRIPATATSGQIDSLVREQMKTTQALYSLDMDVLRDVRPDLIVTQALCDVCAVDAREVSDAACKLDQTPAVINLEPTSLRDLFDNILQVGRAADQERRAEEYVAMLRSRVDAVADRTANHLDRIQRPTDTSQIVAESGDARRTARPSVTLLEWMDPPFSAGHWSPELVRIAGGSELIGVAGQRSVATPWRQIVDADPEVMVVACCGFDLARTLQELPGLVAFPSWKTMRCVRERRVYVVDGSAYFNRPGPRLVDSLEILANALHPNVHPLPQGLKPAFRFDQTLETGPAGGIDSVR
ncbi:cobalamin-binding protein [Roseiconus nitratireducens]|uniref:Cobalamin-binding protein n=1 Tax=Roseiconus nitratireducens TaxID=2605748 RepID=A0A5M6D2U4_9BACT|nr:cobalamin-binding protein [Roseiconus nitratireducens]KAA5539465.1 cobalamin-binding protein [Roseiconus nitratireducens]